jgi:hypothetical protein
MSKQEFRHELRSARFQQRKLIARKIDDELLVFDQETSTAHCLNEIAGEIWAACQRQRTTAEVTDVLRPRMATLQEETVFECLETMAASGLLEEIEPEGISIERRDLIRRAGLLAAALLPIAITSVLIPPAAAAASCAHLGQACSPSHPCCPGGIITVGCVGGVCIKL